MFWKYMELLIKKIKNNNAKRKSKIFKMITTWLLTKHIITDGNNKWK